MPQTCTICRHEKHVEINKALLDGESFRNISKRTGTSTTALHRHKTQHIPRSLVLAKEKAELIHAGTLWDRLRDINGETLAILRETRASKNHVISLQAISRVERQLELEARLLGELDDSARVATGPDYSHLSVEELREQSAILAEAEAKLDALRAPKPTGLIEAAPGSVLSGPAIESGADYEGDPPVT